MPETSTFLPFLVWFNGHGLEGPKTTAPTALNMDKQIHSNTQIVLISQRTNVKWACNVQFLETAQIQQFWKTTASLQKFQAPKITFTNFRVFKGFKDLWNYVNDRFISHRIKYDSSPIWLHITKQLHIAESINHRLFMVLASSLRPFKDYKLVSLYALTTWNGGSHWSAIHSVTCLIITFGCSAEKSEILTKMLTSSSCCTAQNMV